ncbi:unnamed protein product [Diabrotica balteata]|uniref:M-AAA protease-interacting protein 1, mitochondrial n=1 Tax=Diabrotica balteata TaxID=107213 RepID=A0A9N9SVL9_DIABA|nr:unnamed protein product [Diabrotica balteata]
MNINVLFRNVRNYSNLNLGKFNRSITNHFLCKHASFCTKQSSYFLNNKHSNSGLNQRRWYSDDPSSPSNKLPPLLPDSPIFVWPSLFKTIRNFILATFIIKPYLDQEFNLPDFVSASKKAVEVVSQKLSEGDIKSLEGLVTNDIISSLQKAISMMSMSQREQIATSVDDIYFSFPYQVGVIFNEEEGKEQKRFVEITMVYHSLKGLSGMRSRGEEPPLNMGMLPEYQQRISICNYRFIREFTKGVEGDWTVNLLNHFKPIDEKK